MLDRALSDAQLGGNLAVAVPGDLEPATARCAGSGATCASASRASCRAARRSAPWSSGRSGPSAGEPPIVVHEPDRFAARDDPQPGDDVRALRLARDQLEPRVPTASSITPAGPRRRPPGERADDGRGGTVRPLPAAQWRAGRPRGAVALARSRPRGKHSRMEAAAGAREPEAYVPSDPARARRSRPLCSTASPGLTPGPAPGARDGLPQTPGAGTSPSRSGQRRVLARGQRIGFELDAERQSELDCGTFRARTVNRILNPM